MLAQLYEYIKITELYTLNGQIVLCELSINKVINIYEENLLDNTTDGIQI